MDRFWSKVYKTKDPTQCWVYTAFCMPSGYGKFKLNGKKVLAHRLAYELYWGKIPAGLQIDHLCRNTSCVNPAHLEAVTCKENSARSPFTVTSINRAKTHCKNGHPFNSKNTRILSTGKRQCITCYRAWDSNRYYTKRRKLK